MALNEYRCGVFGKKVLARHATILRALQSGEESALNLAPVLGFLAGLLLMRMLLG